MRHLIFTVLLFAVSAIYASPVAISRRPNAWALSAKRSSMPSPTLVNRAGHNNVHSEYSANSLRGFAVIHDYIQVGSMESSLRGATQIAGGEQDPVFRSEYLGKSVIVTKLSGSYDRIDGGIPGTISYFRRVYVWVAWGFDNNFVHYPHADLQKAREDTRDVYRDRYDIDIGTDPKNFIYRYIPLPPSYKAFRV